MPIVPPAVPLAQSGAPLVIPFAESDLRFRNFAPEPGYEVPAEEGPWIPGNPGTADKFCLFDLRKNHFVTVLRGEPGSGVPRHFHTCAVMGYVLCGAWKYREYDWVARAGSFVYEPAGEAHTLEVIGEEVMMTVFHVTGPHITLDAEGRQIGYVDAFVLRDYCYRYCRENGLDTAYFDRITR